MALYFPEEGVALPIDAAYPVHVYCLLALSAAAGGLVSFLYAYRLGRIRDKHCRKATVEVVGGAIVGFIMSAPLEVLLRYKFVIAFAGGVGWTIVVEVFRDKMTQLARAIFYSPAPSDDNGK
jgi:hypothetical protein